MAVFMLGVEGTLNPVITTISSPFTRLVPLLKSAPRVKSIFLDETMVKSPMRVIVVQPAKITALHGLSKKLPEKKHPRN
ncbi:MAG: hypothetical protein WCP12_15280, partial [bacterium]